MTSNEFLHNELDANKNQYDAIKNKKKVYLYSMIIVGILSIVSLACFLYKIFKITINTNLLTILPFILVFFLGMFGCLFLFYKFNSTIKLFKNIELFSDKEKQVQLYKMRFKELIGNDDKELISLKIGNGESSSATFRYGKYNVIYDVLIIRRTRVVGTGKDRKEEVYYDVNLKIDCSLKDSSKENFICTIRKCNSLSKIFGNNSNIYESESLNFNKLFMVNGPDNFIMTKLFKPSLIESYTKIGDKLPKNTVCSIFENGLEIQSTFESNSPPNCAFVIMISKFGNSFDEWINFIISSIDQQYFFFTNLFNFASPFEIDKKDKLL